MFRLSSFILISLLIVGCSTKQSIVEDPKAGKDSAIIKVNNDALVKLQDMMTGSFDSSQQEKEDSSFSFYNNEA